MLDEALLGRAGLVVDISSKILGIFILELGRTSYRYQCWVINIVVTHKSGSDH